MQTHFPLKGGKEDLPQVKQDSWCFLFTQHCCSGPWARRPIGTDRPAPSRKPWKEENFLPIFLFAFLWQVVLFLCGVGVCGGSAGLSPKPPISLPALEACVLLGWTRCWEGITDSVEMHLSKLRDGEGSLACCSLITAVGHY